MKNKILQLNEIYFSSLSLAEDVLKLLQQNHIDSALSFRSQICSRINGELICRKYPMPIVICRINDYNTQIGFDIATSPNYLGFIKFTLSKEETLSFNFCDLKGFDYDIYSTYDYQHFNLNDIKEMKKNIKAYKSCEFRIKIEFSLINQVEAIISKMAKKHRYSHSTCSFTCDCGNEVTIDLQNGKCPVCRKESPFKRKFNRKCPVCKNVGLTDQSGNGECNKCGWIFNVYGQKMKNIVCYPNLVSLNKAKQLYKKGKPFEPNLDEFIEALYCYSEMQFEYNGVYYAVELNNQSNNNVGICLYNAKTKEESNFSTDEDFKNNAKIGNEYLKDIWDKTTDRYWLQ